MLRGVSVLPVFLNLCAQRAVVVGGGAVALRRVRTLLAAELQVTVIAPELHPDLRTLPVQLERRPYREGDLMGARLVVVATDRPDVNAAAAAEARRVGALVNHAADATLGEVRFPATAQRAGVQVAVGTGRELPMLARAVAERVAQLLPGDAQISGWVTAREQALSLEGAGRESALQRLRDDIQAALGVPA
ncbi:hypothetical protein GCM10010841_14900 [Deinococcus aerophilus]|uniref:precorrin-2 dehydrogenase n=1 Tax=Deinococcus aerophilus TaxID=522488 RepID=A0ABQ2GRK5_9DEIO|nr:hypothetical protein GCM10010841_14900 [Deinococcus aerophilus]